MKWSMQQMQQTVRRSRSVRMSKRIKAACCRSPTLLAHDAVDKRYDVNGDA